MMSALTTAQNLLRVNISEATDITRPLKNTPFRPISVSGSNFNPRNTQCIPVVKIFAFLELKRNWTFFKGLITKETRPSRACARWLLYGYRFKLVASLFFQKILFTLHQMRNRAPLGVRNLSSWDSSHNLIWLFKIPTKEKIQWIFWGMTVNYPPVTEVSIFIWSLSFMDRNLSVHGTPLTTNKFLCFKNWSIYQYLLSIV